MTREDVTAISLKTPKFEKKNFEQQKQTRTLRCYEYIQSFLHLILFGNIEMIMLITCTKVQHPTLLPYVIDLGTFFGTRYLQHIRVFLMRSKKMYF